MWRVIALKHDLLFAVQQNRMKDNVSLTRRITRKVKIILLAAIVDLFLARSEWYDSTGLCRLIEVFKDSRRPDWIKNRVVVEDQRNLFSVVRIKIPLRSRLHISSLIGVYSFSVYIRCPLRIVFFQFSQSVIDKFIVNFSQTRNGNANRTLQFFYVCRISGIKTFKARIEFLEEILELFNNENC